MVFILQFVKFAAKWMVGIMLIEISQTEKAKYFMSLICGIKKIQETSSYNKKRNRFNGYRE